MTENATRPDGNVASVHVALNILELFAGAKGELGITEVAQQLSMAKASIYRHFMTLADRGYLARDAKTARYRLAYRFYQLGRTAPVKFDLVAAAKDVMRDLASEIGHNIVVSELSPKGICVLSTIQGDRNPIDIIVRPGTYLSLHNSAQGKVALAFGPPSLREQLTSKDLSRSTDRTITSHRELEREIETVRRRGWSLSDGEAWIGVKAFAVPILYTEGGLAGALAVVGPSKLVKQRQIHENVRALRRGAFEIQEKL